MKRTVEQKTLRLLLSWTMVTLCVAFISSGTAARVAAAEWKAGVAKVKITPKQAMWMSGYGGRDKPSEGTLHDLWAKALVVQDPKGEKIVIITLDLVGIDRDFSADVCQAIQEQHKLERRQIALFTSHTHTGPVVGRNLMPMYMLTEEHVKKIVDYTAELKRNIVSAAAEAVGKLEPATLSWGNGRATFAVNRRNNKEPEVPQLREQGLLKGPNDFDVPVLAVKSGDGKLKAVVFGYACHTTVLSFYQFSGDYAGFAQIELEKAYPGAQAMFFAGCGADQNPLPRRTVELCQKYGRELADAVEGVLKPENKLTPISGELAASYAELPAPFDKLPTRDEILKDTMSANKFLASRGKYLLSLLDAGKPLSPTYPYPVQVWRLGDKLKWVTLGGEVVVDYSLRLKKELGSTDTWVAGYTNDVMAYIPSLRVLKEGGYEGGGSMVYYGLPTIWGPEIEEVIIKGVHELAKQTQSKK